jgi:hypothetical protein
MLSLPAKLIGERRFATMDFTAQLANIGTTFAVSPAPTVTAEHYAGPSDPNPSAILDGPAIVSGNIVGQWIKDSVGIVGATYLLTWKVTLSDGSIVERQRTLPIISKS